MTEYEKLKQLFVELGVDIVEDIMTIRTHPDTVPPGDYLTLEQNIEESSVFCFDMATGRYVGTEGGAGWLPRKP